MSSIKQIHQAAMAKVKLADEALAVGENDTHKTMLLEALDLEKQAAYQLLHAYESEPTRAVLFRSAASIAMRAAAYEEAISLLRQGLSGQPFEEMRAEMAALLREAKSENTANALVLNDDGNDDALEAALAEPQTRGHIKIRLQRSGSKKRPFFFIVVADSRAPRNGAFIQKLGTYNPQTIPAVVQIDRQKALDWLQKGAQPTPVARKLLSVKGVLYLKHLLRGVGLGLFDEATAMAKFSQWSQNQAAIEEKRRKPAGRTLQNQPNRRPVSKGVAHRRGPFGFDEDAGK